MPLERKWEKFAGGPPKRLGEDIRVTINRKGLIYMSGRAYEAFGRPKAVALYYCRQDDSIAMEHAAPRPDETFIVVKKQQGWAVHASTFCRHYNIRVPNTERFVRPDLTPDGHIILNLRETVSVGGVGRGPNRSPRSGGK